MTAEFDARHSTDQSFQLLAARLEPIIAERLAPHLGGLPWTKLLEERDRLRGKTPGLYAATDPQTQLKVLTERLGALGYPFDDHTRTVSVLGGELRIARNRWAHHGELGALDAWRTSDFVVRLFERLGDAEGTDGAGRIREAAFIAVVAEKGIAAHAVPVASTDAEAPIADVTFAVSRVRPDFALATPPGPPVQLDFTRVAEASTRAEKTTALAGDAGGEAVAEQSGQDPFEPWIVLAVGGPEVVDGLPRKTMKEQVRAVGAEIIDFEGPIHLKRVAQLTAASFGIQRLREQREKRISYQIAQIEGTYIDGDKFVWPSGVDPETWRGYRPSTPDTNRDFLSISPVEIANAMRVLSRAGEPDIDRATLRVFGKSRLTWAYRAHLAKARKRI